MLSITKTYCSSQSWKEGDLLRYKRTKKKAVYQLYHVW